MPEACPRCGQSSWVATAQGQVACAGCSGFPGPQPAPLHWAPPGAPGPWAAPASPEVLRAAESLRAYQQLEKKSRWAQQYGICALVFGPLGLVVQLFWLLGVACAIVGLGYGASIRRKGAAGPPGNPVHARALRAIQLSAIALPIAVAAAALNVLWFMPTVLQR